MPAADTLHQPRGIALPAVFGGPIFVGIGWATPHQMVIDSVTKFDGLHDYDPAIE